MKILTKKEQWALIEYIVKTAKLIKLSSFHGDLDHQAKCFATYINETVDVIADINGKEGLAYAKEQLGGRLIV